MQEIAEAYEIEEAIAGGIAAGDLAALGEIVQTVCVAGLLASNCRTATSRS